MFASLLFVLVAMLFFKPAFAAAAPGFNAIPAADTSIRERLYRDVAAITSIDPPRTDENMPSLNAAVAYITGEFGKAGCSVQIQRFKYHNNKYENVICSLGPDKAERIVIGAHYDVKGNKPGADDNASGIAALLELARLMALNEQTLTTRIDFVSYPLEERDLLRQPFRTRHVGSRIHARYLSESKIPLRAMICLDMIGYYTDKPGSQHYPLFFLRWHYPDRGNYIAVVGKLGQARLVAHVRDAMRSASATPVESIAAPSFLPGIDFSDHRSYWLRHYQAVMVTNTAFYRNPNYHKKTDTIDTLDFNRMTEVVKGLYRTILTI